MRLGLFFTLLCVVPGLACGATRDDTNVRIGVTRMSMAGVRAPNMTGNLGGNKNASPTLPTASTSGGITPSSTPVSASTSTPAPQPKPEPTPEPTLSASD